MLPPESPEEIENLRLDGDVERRGRLVQNDKPRVESNCASDADPLALTSAELVREPPQMVLVQADPVQQCERPVEPFLSRNCVRFHRFREDVSDEHPRIERGEWILKDNLKFLPESTHGPRILVDE